MTHRQSIEGPPPSPARRRVGSLAVGVVGCGYWGSKHLRVLRSLEGVGQLVAIDAATGVREALSGRDADLRTTASLANVVDDLDAVVVATPPRTHAEVARTALEAGCHVLVEKPLATSVGDAECLVDLADRQGLVLMSGHTFEHNPAVWKLRDLIQGGELGRVCHVDAARLNLGLYQGDVNVLWDLAPHDLSILNFVLDSRPTAVAAWAGSLAHHQVEDVAYLRLHFEELDLVAQIHVSWLDPRKVRRLTVVGSRKMVVYDDLADDERIKVFDKGVVEAPGPSPATYRHGGSESPHIDFSEPLAVEDRSFLQAIRQGVEPPSSGRSGLAVVQILAAAQEALTLGRTVEIDYRSSLDRPTFTSVSGGAGARSGDGERRRSAS